MRGRTSRYLPNQTLILKLQAFDSLDNGTSVITQANKLQLDKSTWLQEQLNGAGPGPRPIAQLFGIVYQYSPTTCSDTP